MRFLKKLEPLLEPLDHVPSALNPRVQVEIFALEIEQPTPNARHVISRHHATRDLERLQFGLGFLAAPTPGRQFVSQVSEQPLEIGQRRLIRSNVW